NIEPSIQAAFVDFGVGRNGFLHVSDVEPTYFRHLESRGDRDRDRDRGGRGDRGDRRSRDRDRDRGHDRDRGRPAYSADFAFGDEDEPAEQATEPAAPGMADFLAGVDLELDVPPAPEEAPPESEGVAPEAALPPPEAPPAPTEEEEKPLGTP